MKDIELDRGATPRRLSAPSIAEMRDYRPHGGDAVNFMPVMEWLAEKLGKKKWRPRSGPLARRVEERQRPAR